jgi:6-bladed beta-propeller
VYTIKQLKKNLSNGNYFVFNLFSSIYIFTFLSLVLGCKDVVTVNDIEIKGIPEIKIDLLRADTNILKEFEPFFDNPRIISLKSKDTSFFVATINKLISYKNELYIFDKRFSNIIRFDKFGNYITKYGKIGLGPDEYSKISDFDIDSVQNTLIIFSNENSSLYYYSIETASFIKKLSIGMFGSQFSILPNNNILL